MIVPFELFRIILVLTCCPFYTHWDADSSVFSGRLSDLALLSLDEVLPAMNRNNRPIVSSTRGARRYVLSYR